MRPLELTLEGFRSYADRVTFDLRGRRLVAIVGPIGSGKSSVLDAISFALYGRTASVARDTGDLINQRSDRALVELVFEVEGETWRAVRGQTRKGQPPSQLARLDASGEAEVVATGKAQMNAQIERLLGLNFDAFGRSVLLAQNRFAQFLEATTGDRDRVLKGIFGLDALDRAQAEAKARLAAVDMELREHDRRTQEIAEAKARLAEARSRAEAARARLAEVQRAAAAVHRHAAAIEAAGRDEAAAQREVEDLSATAHRLPARDNVEAIASAVADTARAAERTEAARTAAAGAAQRAKEALDLAVERSGGEQALARAASLVAARTEREGAVEAARMRSTAAGDAIEAARRSGEKARVELEALRAKAAKAETDLVSALESVASSSEALEAARHADMAMTLRAGLEPGAVCPVCDQPVHEIPRSRRPPDIGVAERRLATATRRESAARDKRDALNTRLAATTAAVEAASADLARREEAAASATGDLARAETASAEVGAELQQLLGSGDHRRMIEERQRLLEDARAEADRAASELSAAKDASAAADRVAAEAQRGLLALTAEVARAAGALGVEMEPADDAVSLRRAHKQVTAALERRTTRADKALARAREAGELASAALAEVLVGLGLGDVDGFESALRSAAAEEGAAQADVRSLRERVASERELKGKIAATVRRRGCLERLADDLAPSRFLRFLLEEDRSSLARLGSDLCERLTNGRYRFTEDGEFDIVDLTAAERTRRAESLSGGETFLASLALALALAEMVARGGGRLDAFFLDEGFGSLDPEHLDLAMEGIDRLVADDGSRLVVLVSHVPEMRQRIEDLIVLDKDPVTGKTLVRAGARPPGSD